MATRLPDTVHLSDGVEYLGSTGYVWVPIARPAFPETLNIGGTEFRIMPGKLHVSILNARALAGKSGYKERDVIHVIADALAQDNIRLGEWTGAFFHARHPDNLGRQSIVGRVTLSGVGGVMEALREEIYEDLREPWLHATTHTNNGEYGVAIPHAVAFAERCQPVPPDTAQLLRATLVSEIVAQP